MKRYKRKFEELGPLIGPQRGSQPSKKVDPLDLELNEYENKYLKGQSIFNYRKMNQEKKQDIYEQAEILEKQKKITFSLLGYIYNILWS